MKRRSVLVMAGGLLLVLGACSGDDPNGGAADGGSSSDGGSPQEIISASASATQEAGSARIESEQVTTVQGQELTTTLEGTVDLASGDSDSTLELSLPGQET